jgi:hypothetical protein
VACVDRADSGQSVHLRVGQTLEVVLGGTALRWSGLHQRGPHILRQKGNVNAQGGEIAAVFTAVKAGRTTLQAGGAPKCSPGQACPMFVLLWQVRVLVG